MIRLENICKYYSKNSVTALNNVNLNINDGEMVALMGKSGSGKSTLLNIIGLLDYFSSGRYYFNDNLIGNNKYKFNEAIRKDYFGFVVQNFALIPDRTIYYNISLPLIYRKVPKNEIRRKVLALSDTLGIRKLLKSYPYQISGGESQRAAIARALITNPKVILADEPTGSLDNENEKNILDIFSRLNSRGVTIIMATHDNTVSKSCNRVIMLSDGKIVGK